MHRVLTSAGVVVLLLVASEARADEGLHLTWTAPSECPSTDDVRTATLRGGDTQAANNEKGATLEAEARVERRDASSWTVRLRTRRGEATGEREIVAMTCEGAADATAVVLALALFPSGVDGALANDADAPEARPPRSETVAPAPRDDAGAHRLAVGVAIAGDTATLPSMTVGGSLIAAWTPGRFRLEADARRWAAQKQAAPSSTAGARFSMTSLGGRGCWAALQAGGYGLSPCAGADVHWVSASGYGADDNFEASGAWTAIAGGALGTLSFTTWLAIRARVEAVAPLARPRFVVENDGVVYRPSNLGVAASIGVEAHFF